MKLIRINLSLTEEGFKWRETEWEGEEKTSTYFIKPIGDESDKHDWQNKNRVIKKNNLLVTENKTLDTHKFVSYSIWCLVEQKEQAKEILENRVRKVANKIKESALKMFSYL